MPTLRKLQKAKARRKDYVRKRNIVHNAPKQTAVQTVERYAHQLDDEGNPIMEMGRVKLRVIGEKQKIIRFRSKNPSVAFKSLFTRPVYRKFINVTSK